MSEEEEKIELECTSARQTIRTAALEHTRKGGGEGGIP